MPRQTNLVLHCISSTLTNMKCSFVQFLLVTVLSVGPSVPVLATDPAQDPLLCPEGPEGIACLGSNIAGNLAGQLFGASTESLDASPRHLLDGFEMVHVANGSSDSLNEEEHEGRDISDKLLRNVRKLFSNYELRVRLSELLNGALTDVSESQGRKGGGLGGGKLGKKGGGLMLAMMMMGGMMKMMAMGALAMLAMKALTVSSLAFMLSLIVGLKKLLSKKDDDDGGHVVQVVGSGHGDHHRRAFIVDSTAAHQLAYRGQQRK